MPVTQTWVSPDVVSSGPCESRQERQHAAHALVAAMHAHVLTRPRRLRSRRLVPRAAAGTQRGAGLGCAVTPHRCCGYVRRAAHEALAACGSWPGAAHRHTEQGRTRASHQTQAGVRRRTPTSRGRQVHSGSDGAPATAQHNNRAAC